MAQRIYIDNKDNRRLKRVGKIINTICNLCKKDCGSTAALNGHLISHTKHSELQTQENFDKFLKKNHYKLNGTEIIEENIKWIKISP